MTREQQFAAAKAKRKQEKIEEETKKANGGFTPFEQTAYGALELNQYRVYRFLGGPMKYRESPTDPKLIEQSMIKGDDDKKFRCTWPLKEDQPDWILRRVYDKLTVGTWEKVDGKNKKTFTHQAKHPELMNRVLFNNNMDNQYESGWRPGKAVMVNIIDRQDMAYHEEHKHSKILSKKANEGNEGKIYFERGVPITTYNTVWDKVVEYEGDWENYDVAILKVKDTPYYEAWYGGSDDLKKRLVQDSPEVLDLISVKPLEAWEKDLELYNIDEITPVTSYSRLYEKLGSFFKKVDGELNTDFHSELKALKEKEAEEKAEKAKEDAEKELAEPAKETPKAETKPTTEPVKEETKVEEVKEEVKTEAPKTRTRQATTPAVEEAPAGITDETWAGLADGTYNGTVYQGVAKLSDEEKSQVISIRENGSFEYVKEFNGEALELFEESETKFESPGTFKTCPMSGVVFS